MHGVFLRMYYYNKHKIVQYKKRRKKDDLPIFILGPLVE